MEFKEINRRVSLSSAEKEKISKSLIDAGIDPELIKGVLADVSTTCTAAGPCIHSHQCNGYGSPSNKLQQLQKEIKNKNINIANLDPSVAKLLK